MLNDDSLAIWNEIKHVLKINFIYFNILIWLLEFLITYLASLILLDRVTLGLW